MKAKNKNKGGRPLVVLSGKQIKEVEELAAYLTCEQIADYFGISHTTFQEIRARQEEVSFAYKRGKVRKIYKYAKTLENKAFGINENETLKYDTTSIIFFLKTQARWSEAIPEVKIEERTIETPEEKAARLEEIKLYTKWKNEMAKKLVSNNE